MEKIMKTITKIYTLFLRKLMLVMLCVSVSLIITQCNSKDDSHDNHVDEKNVKTWTCSMHPQIRLPKPGKCPICGMDLIPLPTERMDGSNESKDTDNDRIISLTPYAKKLADIQTVVITRSDRNVEVKLVGKIDYDETRLKHIATKVSGRIERLFVDSTGIRIKAGDHLFEMYSPEILTAHQELIQAQKVLSDENLKVSKALYDSTSNMLESVRHKFQLWGLSSAQVQSLEKSDTPTDRITMYAPIGGVVIEKNGIEGMYVGVGEKIYSIADLSTVWLKLEAFESDIAWIHYGQKVEFSIEAYPGEVFLGRVSFISPVVNSDTRTVSLRVNVENKKDRLKPNMLARAIVRAKVNNEQKIIDDELADKWMCPMHPEIIKPNRGKCDICGMDLVKASSYGYVHKKNGDTSPLSIPASAILFTGKRSVVYVEVPNAKSPTYEGREVVLGPRAGDYYIVKSGIQEGESVVVNGNFKIDSALQIQAKPSMMSVINQADNPLPSSESTDQNDTFLSEEEKKSQNNHPPQTQSQTLDAIIQAYLVFSDSLVSDQFDLSKQNYMILKNMVIGISNNDTLYSNLSSLRSIFSSADPNSIEQLRERFSFVSQSLIDLRKKYSATGKILYHIAHCPMALEGKGANWIQKDKDIKNPYFGSAMLGCGSITESIR